MKKMLTCEFSQTMDAHKVHKELSRRNKKLSETYYEYIYQIFEIAKEVEDSAIIKYIIDGIQDDEINKTVLYGAKNIHKLKEKFMLYTEGYEGEYESERQTS
ncbi:hypothetical protein QLX08_008344 [Tetragonisca angustula]|uniref:Uncharacterized protein n=1 Tax=Tetragonisca angustula TaxID=166442 RepID=A0AAW0ZLE5_9HYME